MAKLVIRMAIVAIAVAAAPMLVPLQVLAAFPSSTFDADTQGWTTIGSNTDYGPPSASVGTSSTNWDTRGNPGGALQVGDYFYSTWISAPARYLGNQSDMFGQTFSYDIFIRYTDQTSVPYPSVAIVGNDLKLLFSRATPPVNAWDRRVVAFDPLLWTVDVGSGAPNSGAVATQAQLISVLSNLTGLYLLTEWRTGPDDTSVDNIGTGFTKPLDGDYNHDNAVGAGDYVLIKKQFNSVYTQTDYTIWRSHFGQTAAGTGAGALADTAVPEPTTLVPLLFAAAGWCIRRRRSA
jgi:hypothetical protein